MADNKEKKQAEKEAKLAAEEALKKKKERIKQNKPKKDGDAPNIFARMGKGIAKFVKDFRGTAKKIIWPDRQTVLKGTGVVLAVVLVIGTCVWGFDYVITNGISFVKGALDEMGDTPVETTGDHGDDDGHNHDDDDGHDHDHDDDDHDDDDADGDETLPGETAPGEGNEE